MKCVKPITLNVPGIYPGLLVPCGKCIACRIARTQEWSLRIWHEYSSFGKGNFTTLTYSDDHLSPTGSLVKRDLQLFFKRLRRDIGDRRIKYFACGEYGDTYFRPHYHAIILGMDNSSKDIQLITENWPHGHVKVLPVNVTRMNYVCKYITKKLSGDVADEYYGKLEKPFQLQSKGLGLDFALKNEDLIKRELVLTQYGKKVCLPKYYVSKLNIDKELIKAKALEAQDKLEEYYYDKKGVKNEAEFSLALYKARRQAEKNYKARMSLRKKDSDF